jgi:hypothetical protein
MLGGQIYKEEGGGKKSKFNTLLEMMPEYGFLIENKISIPEAFFIE